MKEFNSLIESCQTVPLYEGGVSRQSSKSTSDEKFLKIIKMLQLIFMPKTQNVINKNKVRNLRENITSNEELRKSHCRSELIRYLIQLNP